MRIRAEHRPDARPVPVARRRVHRCHAGIALVRLGLRVIWGDRHDLISKRPDYDDVIGVTTTNASGGW